MTNPINNNRGGMIGGIIGGAMKSMGMSPTLLAELQRPTLSQTDVDMARRWAKDQAGKPHAQVAQNMLQHVEKRFANQGNWETFKESARDAVMLPGETQRAVIGNIKA